MRQGTSNNKVWSSTKEACQTLSGGADPPLDAMVILPEWPKDKDDPDLCYLNLWLVRLWGLARVSSGRADLCLRALVSGKLSGCEGYNIVNTVVFSQVGPGPG